MQRSTQGFTLIELLVVVTIIVVLLALLVPAMDKAMEQAIQAQCGAQQHGLLTIFQTYALEKGRRKFPSGLAEDGSDATSFVPFDLVRIVEAVTGNNKIVRGTVVTHWGGTLTTGIVPKMLVDPNYRDFGYHSQTLGYVIGYQYLGGRPILSRANDASLKGEPWESPIGLSKMGDGQLVTCWNQWAEDGPWSWVAHSREGGSLGVDPPSGGGYHYNGPGAGGDVFDLSAGENIGTADGAVTWTPIERTKIHVTVPWSAQVRWGRW